MPGLLLPGLTAMDGHSDFASHETDRAAPRDFSVPSAFTVTGIARASHPHFPKQTRSSRPPAPRPAQPSLPMYAPHSTTPHPIRQQKRTQGTITPADARDRCRRLLPIRRAAWRAEDAPFAQRGMRSPSRITRRGLRNPSHTAQYGMRKTRLFVQRDAQNSSRVT